MLRNSIQKGAHSYCNAMFLFLTDGIDKSGADILDEIALLQVLLRFFTFQEKLKLKLEIDLNFQFQNWSKFFEKKKVSSFLW